MAKAQTMAIIMGRSGLPLEGFIVPELEGAMLIGGGWRKINGEIKNINLCNRMMKTLREVYE